MSDDLNIKGVYILPASEAYNDSHNSYIDNIDLRDSKGITELHYAAYDGNITLVQSLLDRGASVNIKTPDGKTSLDLALLKGHHDVANILETQRVEIRNQLGSKHQHHLVP